MEKQLYIFDVDGTLTKTKSGNLFRKHAGDWEVLPGVEEKLKGLKANGAKLAIASNQGGISFGYMEQGDMDRELTVLAAQLDIDYVEVCYIHPKATIEEYQGESYDRKPQPGMLLKILGYACIVPSQAVMIGDRQVDSEAAIAAGMEFIEGAKFFTQDVPQEPQEPIDQLQLGALVDIMATDLKTDTPQRYLLIPDPTEDDTHLIHHRWDGVFITQSNPDEKYDKRIHLRWEEIPALLKILLQVQTERWKEAQEEKKKQTELGSLDDHPF